MEKSGGTPSLRLGAKNWRLRRSNFETLPHTLKIYDKINSLYLQPGDQAGKCLLLYSHDSTERVETIYDVIVSQWAQHSFVISNVGGVLL